MSLDRQEGKERKCECEDGGRKGGAKGGTAGWARASNGRSQCHFPIDAALHHQQGKPPAPLKLNTVKR